MGLCDTKFNYSDKILIKAAEHNESVCSAEQGEDVRIIMDGSLFHALLGGDSIVIRSKTYANEEFAQKENF